MRRRTTLHFDTPKPEKRERQPDDPACFDLSDPRTYALVQRVYFGRFAGRIAAAGVEPEEGFQTVLEGLLRKSMSTRSRWNPDRGSLATWIYVAVSGLVLNLLKSHYRALKRGALGWTDDVSTWNRVAPAGNELEDRLLAALDQPRRGTAAPALQ